MMPSVSEKQRRFMGAELGRLREGKKTKTGMSEEKLKDFAEKPIEKAGIIGDDADSKVNRIMSNTLSDTLARYLAAHPKLNEVDHSKVAAWASKQSNPSKVKNVGGLEKGEINHNLSSLDAYHASGKKKKSPPYTPGGMPNVPNQEIKKESEKTLKPGQKIPNKPGTYKFNIDGKTYHTSVLKELSDKIDNFIAKKLVSPDWKLPCPICGQYQHSKESFEDHKARAQKEDSRLINRLKGVKQHMFSKENGPAKIQPDEMTPSERQEHAEKLVGQQERDRDARLEMKSLLNRFDDFVAKMTIK
jgi:hypothetical protein